LNPNKASEEIETPADTSPPSEEDSKAPTEDFQTPPPDKKSDSDPSEHSEPTISGKNEIETLESAQSLNDKKTISRLTNKIKELEILLEAEKNDTLIQQKNKNIANLEKQVAKAEKELEEKERVVHQLEISLKELQAKNEVGSKLEGRDRMI
jgi:predicted RNase H-like nuclease (RuvC/YqgF family)